MVWCGTGCVGSCDYPLGKADLTVWLAVWCGVALALQVMVTTLLAVWCVELALQVKVTTYQGGLT